MRLLLSLLPIWKKKDLHSSLTAIPPVAMPSPGSRKSTPALTAAADPKFHTNWYIQHIQNHHPITVLVYKVVVYVFVLHFSRERKEFVLRVLSLKMYISYNTNVRKLCPISNKSIKFIKKLVAIINMPPPLQTPDYIQ